MVKLALAIDDHARALRKRYEDDVEAPRTRGEEMIADARFKVYGTDTYPDATFTLRVTFGAVEGWKEKGEMVDPFTRTSRLFERATELGSDSASLQNNWGAALLQLERDEEALDHFRRAIALDPGHPQAPLNAGALLERLGRKEEAAQIYRIALARDPNHPARQRLDGLEQP